MQCILSFQNAINAATKLKKNQSRETGLTSTDDKEILEINEGMEPEEFINGKDLYLVLIYYYIRIINKINFIAQHWDK